MKDRDYPRRGSYLARVQLQDIHDRHRQLGLVVTFAHCPGVLSLGGSPGDLFTELLRLAEIGALAESRRSAGGEYEDLLMDAKVDWDRRLRP